MRLKTEANFNGELVALSRRGGDEDDRVVALGVFRRRDGWGVYDRHKALHLFQTRLAAISFGERMASRAHKAGMKVIFLVHDTNTPEVRPWVTNCLRFTPAPPENLSSTEAEGRERPVNSQPKQSILAD